ncbi:unnamed protein product, partial [Staurois parvus]
MLLPGPDVSWVPVRPPMLLSPSPHSAMCHFQVSSHTAGCVEFFDIGVLADYGPPIAAARPLICHRPLYIPPPHAAARSRVSHGSLYGLHCCCLHRHTLPCATFRSPHTAGVFHFL